MCKSVIIEGEAYETIGGLKERLSGKVVMLENTTQDSRLDDMCCCGVDVPATAALNGYTAADDGMDWHLWKEKPQGPIWVDLSPSLLDQATMSQVVRIANLAMNRLTMRDWGEIFAEVGLRPHIGLHNGGETTE